MSSCLSKYVGSAFRAKGFCKRIADCFGNLRSRFKHLQQLSSLVKLGKCYGKLCLSFCLCKQLRLDAFCFGHQRCLFSFCLCEQPGFLAVRICKQDSLLRSRLAFSALSCCFLVSISLNFDSICILSS